MTVVDQGLVVFSMMVLRVHESNYLHKYASGHIYVEWYVLAVRDGFAHLPTHQTPQTFLKQMAVGFAEIGIPMS